ncbi:TetR/AcrR family transcriptional regulator [Pelagerythrobacter rhizovicinus]|nr:TetR/AcrR family transcriptional regulator [Pelagerythrobacter rhizovicinus]
MTDSSDSEQPIPPSRAYHRGNVAGDLRKAAERILASEDLEDVTVRRLTREVGVAPANFYNHYQNLDELFLLIASSSLDQAIARAISIWSNEGSKQELLVASATDFIRFCLQNRQLMRLMLRRQAHQTAVKYVETSDRSFSEIVRFIYGIQTDPSAPVCNASQHGVAVGYVALTYGFALILSEGRFSVNVDDDAELARFVRNGILPFLDGSAAAVLGSGRPGTS